MKPKRPLDPYLFLAPTALVLGLFFFWPLALVFKNSFYRWDMLTPPEWVGTANYAQIARERRALGHDRADRSPTASSSS